MTEKYNYINYYNNNLYIKNNLYIRSILKMSFVTPPTSPTKTGKKEVCPYAPIRVRTKSSNQNDKIKGKILFPSFESLDLDLDFSTPNIGITYNEEGAPSKKRKTISYSSESLNSLKKNLDEEHFSKTSKYASKLRKKIDANNRKIAMNYVKQLLQDLRYQK